MADWFCTFNLGRVLRLCTPSAMRPLGRHSESYFFFVFVSFITSNQSLGTWDKLHLVCTTCWHWSTKPEEHVDSLASLAMTEQLRAKVKVKDGSQREKNDFAGDTKLMLVMEHHDNCTTLLQTEARDHNVALNFSGYYGTGTEQFLGLPDNLCSCADWDLACGWPHESYPQWRCLHILHLLPGSSSTCKQTHSHFLFFFFTFSV